MKPWIFLILFLLGFPAVAQETRITGTTEGSAEAERFANMDRRFKIDLWKTSEPLQEKLIADLKVLEDSLRKAKKIAEADLVRAEQAVLRKWLDEKEVEMKQLEAEHKAVSPEAIDPPPLDKNPTNPFARQPSLLAMNSADLGGKLSYDAADQLIRGWANLGDHATWALDNVPVGAYDISIEYSAVREVELQVSTSSNLSFVTLGASGQLDKFQKQTLATVGVGKEKKATLALGLAKSRNEEALYLRNVILTPVKPSFEGLFD